MSESKIRFEDVAALKLTLVLEYTPESQYDVHESLRKWAADRGLVVRSSSSAAVCRICNGNGWVIAMPLAPGCVQSSETCSACGRHKSGKVAFDRARGLQHLYQQTGEGIEP